jgi:signal transduction histidine kinase
VLTRRLAVKLLAPTVTVSLALVAACTFGIWYLNYLHVNVSRDLSENVQSTQVAARLETTAEKLIALLRTRDALTAHLEQQVEEYNQEARTLLEEAHALANTELEALLVDEIEAGFSQYLLDWQRHDKEARTADSLIGRASLVELLDKKMLVPCRDLRQYNTDQIEQSDRENRSIVQKLRWGLLIVAIGLPLGGLVIGYAVARSLRHSIYQLSVRIRDAAGRLNRELGSVTLQEEGDFPDLHRQMQTVTAEIERIVEQLQQREREVLRAEQLAAVGQVAAGVAHELRNPLTAVKMLVQTGLEGAAPTGLLPEELCVIEHEVRRMEQCIRLFLDFARPPACERRRSNLLDVLQRALALIEGRARRQKVTITMDNAAGPMVLNIDPEQIHQVLVNLLLNALDALPHGGSLHLSISAEVQPATRAHALAAHLDGDGVPSHLQVRIADTGPGIAPWIRERLFEPFVSSKEAGLGLGLSICKRLIEAHGGTICGHNGRNGGAVFTFTLPLEQESEQAVLEIAGARSPGVS